MFGTRSVVSVVYIFAQLVELMVFLICIVMTEANVVENVLL
jgi:hypothetical protein